MILRIHYTIYSIHYTFYIIHYTLYILNYTPPRHAQAGAAVPRLEEGDHVLSINCILVDTLAHNQIVAMIQSSSTQHGKLQLIVKKTSVDGEWSEVQIYLAITTRISRL